MSNFILSCSFKHKEGECALFFKIFFENKLLKIYYYITKSQS